MPTVYIVNKSSHDFSPAKQFGKLRYLTAGILDRYNVNNMHRQVADKLEHSKEDDYIVPCSLNTLNSIVCSVFAVKHKRLNLLLFRRGEYLERNIVF